MAYNFEKHAAKGNRFVKEVGEYLGDGSNRDKSVRILKTVLHAIRNQLTVEENLHLISQLPLVIKGIYVDNWKISGSPKRVRTIDGFCEELRYISGITADEDFTTKEDCLDAVHAVFSVIKDHVSEGEIEDIRAIFPGDLKELWDEKAYH
jgi:uncharacterized protein (DUF2267 family)